MDRGAWWATVRGIAESDTAEHMAHAVPGAMLSAGVNYPFQHHPFLHSTRLGDGEHHPRRTGGWGQGTVPPAAEDTGRSKLKSRPSGH